MKGFNRMNVNGIAGIMFCVLCCSGEVWAQTSNVSIGTDQLKSSTVLWLNGNGTNQGLLLPAVANRAAFTGLNNNDDKGMVIFDKSDNKVYYWNGAAWTEAGGGSGGTNQTLTISGNTFNLTGSPASNVNLASNAPAIGQALVWNGTAWTAAALAGDVTGTASTTQVGGLKGKTIPALPTSTQALVYDGTNWVFQAISSAGEANTASNVGTAGVGVFKQKTGVNLEFQKINAASNRVSVTADGANSEVDIDVNQANLSIANTQVTGLGALATLGAVGSTQITDLSITNADVSATAAIDVTKLNSGGVTNNGKVLKVVAGNLAFAADDVGTGAAILATGQILVGNGTTNTAATVTGDINMATGGDLQLKSAVVTATELAADAVVTGKILDGTIATADIANDAIVTGKILDGTITNADIATAAAVDVTKLNSGGVTNNGKVLKVVAGALAFAADDVGTGAAILATGQILVGNGTTNTAATVTGDINMATDGDLQLKSAVVTATELATDAVVTGKILDGTIATADIANDAVDAAKLRDDATTDGNRAVTTNHIRDNAITTAKIANATIVAADLNAMGATTAQVLQFDGTVWAPADLPASGTGTVTSVGLTLPAIFNVTSSPITTSGTIAATLVSQAANTVLAAPNGSAGAPTFRTLVTGDIASGTFGVARGGTGLATTPTNGQVLIGNGTGYTLSTLTQGTGVTITNGAGTITIASNALVNPMTTSGDIIFGGASGAATRLPGVAGFLKSSGASAPAWSAIDLTADVSGILPVANGGTGRATWDGLLLGSGANISDVSTGTNGQYLRVAGTTPSWSNLTVTSTDITDGTITGADLATGISISTTGNLATSGTGTLSIAGASTLSGVVTLANLAGTGTRMVVASPTGVLSTQAIPGGGTALVTDNVIPVGDGTNQIASSLTDNGTTVSSSNDINLATGKVIKINNQTILSNIGTNTTFLGNLVGAANTGVNNTFLGWSAGEDNTSGAENTFVGSLAGANNTNGGSDTYIGRGAGRSMTGGSLNTIIGYNAGFSSTSFNGTTVIGANAGRLSTGGLNVFIGETAGEFNTSGFQNIFIGRASGTSNTTGFHNILIGADADVGTGNLSNAVAIGFNALVTASNSIVLGVAGENVGIGGVSAPNASLDVASAVAGFVAEFDRNIATGTGILGFQRQGVLQGSISESGGTISYNPFTGSHYAFSTQNLEMGTLVSMTGKFEKMNGQGEPVYEVIVSSKPNDSQLLGSYLHTADEPQSINGKPIKVIMAVGNGTMWVADQGDNLQVGDYLISSSVPGHAMKDQGEYDITYIIARAAEPVTWNAETAMINGVRHKLISVFYESFTRNHKAEKLAKEVEVLRAEVNALKQDSQGKMGQLQNEVENLKKMMTAFSNN